MRHLLSALSPILQQLLRPLPPPLVFGLGLLLAAGAASLHAQPSSSDSPIDLSGDWSFALGGSEPSFPQAPKAPALTFTDTITLPGTTETRGKGPENTRTEMGSLTRLRWFEGAAWYQRTLTIPTTWAGRRIILELERTKYTQVWFDGKAVGTDTTATASQLFDLSSLATPGEHTLLIMVDNRAARRPVLAEAHQFSDNTQTNWNGIIGHLRLVSTPLVWIDSLEVHSDVAARAFRVKALLRNATGSASEATLTLGASSFNHPGSPVSSAPIQVSTALPGASAALEITLPLGDKAPLWDEFAPALHTVSARLSSPAGIQYLDTETGLRDFRSRDGRFTINGRPTFLRGKHDGCVFPLTGHPPMDLEGWLKYLSVCRDYGINHIRCHTWVPPEAAFRAANRLGIYLQPELPFWGTFTAAVRDFLAPEAEATLRAYGNHPCFVMFTLGNEIGGDRTLMNALVCALRARDPRRLYADGSNNVLWDPVFQPTNEFWSSAKAINPATKGKQVPARGSFCVFDGADGHTQWGPANTRVDLSAAIAGIPVPFVGHETGQWTTYPDFAEIAKYTGVTRARNLEAFRARLARQGMSDMNKAFHRASAALAADLYKEENELFLRTAGMGGFQLLDLQDFPGQGTALVGVLDAFMHSKGAVTPEGWRRSCDDLVALARFDKYTWTSAETYLADLQLAHYGPADLEGALVRWELRDRAGHAVAGQTLPAQFIAQGGLRNLGRAEASLASIKAPARLDLVVSIEVPATARTVTNSWPVWVYPAANDIPAAPAGVSLVRSYNADTRALLASGARVVLCPDSSNWADTLPGAYATDYWCWPMFNNTPGTMGLLIAPAAPALSGFPSSEHSERQWSVIAHASTPVILAGLPPTLRPTVQVIDNLERNEKLGLLFELRVGPGSLLVCAADLPALAGKNPEARQLLASLLAYAASPAFAPAVSIPPADLDRVLRPSLARGKPITATSFFQPPWGSVPAPERAVDGDINTRWIADTADKAPSLTVDLGSIQSVDTIQLVWENDEAGYAWTAEASADGASWTPLCTHPATTTDKGRHVESFEPAPARFVRISAKAYPEGRRFCLRDFRVLGR